MNLKTLSLIVISTSIYCAIAQKPPKEFGDVNFQDFKLNLPDTAEAIIIFDKGDVTVNPGKWKGTTSTRHVRIKIIKNSALKIGNFEFSVERNSLSKIKGATYNLENGVIKQYPLDENLIIDNHENYYRDKVVIALPNVKEGSIIELSYTQKNRGLRLPGWRFQTAVPTLWSEYTMHAPIEDYVSNLRGSVKPSQYEEKKDGKYRHWIMKNVPAFKSEHLMPDEEVYISSVEFSGRYKDWGAVVYDLNKHEGFTPILSGTNSLQTQVDKILGGIKDSLERVKTISTFVKNKIGYTDVDDFLADDPKLVIENKKGTTGDINLIFGSLLKKAGFDVSLVLLSTRDNGYVLQHFPSANQFNYVICRIVINKKELLLDATDKKLAFTDLPEKCFNHNGLLISPKHYGWIAVEPQKRNKIFLDAKLNVNADGTLSGNLVSSRYDYAGYDARQKWSKKGKESLQEDILGNNLWTVTKSELLNQDDIEKPVVENYEISQQLATVTPELIYINSHPFLREESNPFTSETRSYPVDFTSLTDYYTNVTFIVPSGYEVDELPESKVLTLPGNAAKCTVTTTKKDNTVTVISRLQINQTLFQPEAYHSLKEFYTRLVAKKAETIVLKKK